ncbi:MAG: AI-2E family transporter [Candidatus Paceibacterota bacterium]
MQGKNAEKYFFLGLLLITLIITFLIFRPFVIILILGVSVALVLYPIYSWLIKKGLPSWAAALLTLIFFIVVLCIPIFGIGSLVFNQTQDLLQTVLGNGGHNRFVNTLGLKINQFLPRGVELDVNARISDFLSFLTGNIANIFGATLSIIFSFALLLLTVFYFLKDGENWKKDILKLSPLSAEDDRKILDRLSLTINGVIKGNLLIMFIQGGLMGIGLTLFRVPNGALWGVVAGIASIIPPLGTAIVSVPAVIFLFATGHTGLAVGMFIWAVLVVGMGDNLLSPYIIGNKIDIPPFLILFSVLGGISLLGPVGILIGPLTVSLLYTLAEIYRTEFMT